MLRQTTMAKKEEVTRKWYVVDATDKPLGRLASEIAIVLMGKNKPSWVLPAPYTRCLERYRQARRKDELLQPCRRQIAGCQQHGTEHPVRIAALG